MSFPIFTSSTTAEEVVTALADEIKGKNGESFMQYFSNHQTHHDCRILAFYLYLVLITGTSMNGIGFEAARTIAKHANLLIITGYNSERHYSTLVQFWICAEHPRMQT